METTKTWHILKKLFKTNVKFQSHKEHAISFFVNTNPRVTLRDNIYEKLQEVLMWIDIEDKVYEEMLVGVNNKDGKPVGRKHVIILTFDWYSKEAEEGQDRDRASRFAYELRTSPSKYSMLKNLLYKISTENILDLTFIPYGLDKLTNQRTMREIILQ